MYRCLYSIETASDRIQELIHRNMDVEKILENIRMARKHGIMVHANFILGFPTETEAEARHTVATALASDLHTVAFYRAIAFPGTELHRMAKEAGAELHDSPLHLEYHVSNTVNLSSIPDDVINGLQREAYRKFYLSPKRLIAILRALPNVRRNLPSLFMIFLRRAFLW